MAAGRGTVKYVIIATIGDHELTYTIDATDARTAHAHGAMIAPDSATIRVYPATMDTDGQINADGIARGALMVARRTAINAVIRTGGNATQCRIERELAAANARCHGAESARRIIDVVADYSADTQDFFAVAAAGLTDAIMDGADIVEQYHAAYLALNKHIHAQRAATARELSMEYIVDGGGDIVAINTAVSAIIRGGDRWTAADSGNMDAATATRLGATIAAAMRTVSPTQRQIAAMLGRGYSQRQIADRTGRGLATVNRNIAIMRGKISGYIRTHAPEFADMVDSATVAAAAERATTDSRTAAAAERKAALDRATQAGRARRYRARKAAERKAQQDK